MEIHVKFVVSVDPPVKATRYGISPGEAMTVARFCNRDLYVISSSETARAAAEKMANHGVGTLVVLNQDAEPVGMLTDRDIALRIVAPARHPEKTTVLEVMTGLARTVSEETPLEEALAIMEKGGFRRLPVTDGEGNATGFLSLDDIVGLLAREMDLVGRLIEGQCPAGTA